MAQKPHAVAAKIVMHALIASIAKIVVKMGEVAAFVNKYSVISKIIN